MLWKGFRTLYTEFGRRKRLHVMKILQSISVFSSSKDCFLCTVVFYCPHTYWSASDTERGHAERAEWQLRSALWTWKKHFALSWKQTGVWLKSIDSQCTDIKQLGPRGTSRLPDLASCTTEAIEFPAISSSSLTICEACLPERHPIVSWK